MISINWGTSVISIPQSYLNFISGTLYELDTDAFRLDLKSLEASVAGMPYLRTHDHNTTYTVAGVEYARKVEILNNYSVEFEDGAYSVRLDGSNNNIFDIESGILVQNQVQIIPGNSAGLIVVTQGSGVTEQDKLDIADRVWDEMSTVHVDGGTFGELMATINNLTEEIHRLHGLEVGTELKVTKTARTAGNIIQTIAATDAESKVNRTP